MLVTINESQISLKRTMESGTYVRRQTFTAFIFTLNKTSVRSILWSWPLREHAQETNDANCDEEGGNSIREIEDKGF